MRLPNSKRGFTLLETMAVVVILALIAAVMTLSFSSLGTAQTLDKATLSVMSLLNEARSLAISSKNAADYGLRIGKTKVTSFQDSYGTGNKDFVLSTLVGISTSTGIGTDVIFQNVSGETTASGTITLYLLSAPSQSSTIRVFSTGVVERN